MFNITIPLILILTLLEGCHGQCGPPPQIEGAEVVTSEEPLSEATFSIYHYRCIDGYTMVPRDHDTVACLKHGFTALPKCIKKEDIPSCGPIPSIVHGQMKETTFGLDYRDSQPGDRAFYECDSGYELEHAHHAFSKCTFQTAWTDVPKCVRKAARHQVFEDSFLPQRVRRDADEETEVPEDTEGEEGGEEVDGIMIWAIIITILFVVLFILALFIPKIFHSVWLKSKGEKLDEDGVLCCRVVCYPTADLESGNSEGKMCCAACFPTSSTLNRDITHKCRQNGKCLGCFPTSSALNQDISQRNSKCTGCFPSSSTTNGNTTHQCRKNGKCVGCFPSSSTLNRDNSQKCRKNGQWSLCFCCKPEPVPLDRYGMRHISVHEYCESIPTSSKGIQTIQVETPVETIGVQTDGPLMEEEKHVAAVVDNDIEEDEKVETTEIAIQTDPVEPAEEPAATDDEPLLPKPKPIKIKKSKNPKRPSEYREEWDEVKYGKFPFKSILYHSKGHTRNTAGKEIDETEWQRSYLKSLRKWRGENPATPAKAMPLKSKRRFSRIRLRHKVNCSC